MRLNDHEAEPVGHLSTGRGRLPGFLPARQGTATWCENRLALARFLIAVGPGGIGQEPQDVLAEDQAAALLEERTSPFLPGEVGLAQERGGRRQGLALDVRSPLGPERIEVGSDPPGTRAPCPGSPKRSRARAPPRP